MRAHRLLFVVAVFAAGFAACNLNPQPLPPGTENAEDPGARYADGGARDAGAVSAEAPPTEDAGSPPPVPNDADAGDAGDAGDADAGDAGDAGDADAS